MRDELFANLLIPKIPRTIGLSFNSSVQASSISTRWKSAT